MLGWMHPASPSAARDGVSGEKMNLHPDGHLNVQQRIKERS